MGDWHAVNTSESLLGKTSLTSSAICNRWREGSHAPRVYADEEARGRAFATSSGPVGSSFGHPSLTDRALSRSRQAPWDSRAEELGSIAGPSDLSRGAASTGRGRPSPRCPAGDHQEQPRADGHSTCWQSNLRPSRQVLPAGSRHLSVVVRRRWAIHARLVLGRMGPGMETMDV